MSRSRTLAFAALLAAGLLAACSDTTAPRADSSTGANFRCETQGSNSYHC
jgi:hypothetical protein